MRKKKVVFQSDFSLVKTGFGRNSKAILDYLYRTGKYDLVHYVVGFQSANPELNRTPWKSVGCLPNTREEIEAIRRDPQVEKVAGYGSLNLDKVIYEEKPDVYIAAQDIWGVDFAIERKWFKEITSAIWTTLDSLPILPNAIKVAPKVKNYWVWSSFATKALHELGHKHVKTVHGAVEDAPFKRLSDNGRTKLREKNDIPQDAFVVGFVFRNQLRKSVPNLLEGFSMFKRENPAVKNPRLLLHTHFGEGWNIKKLAEEYKIPKEEILTTHICRACGNYEVKFFDGQEKECPYCHDKKSQVTTNPGIGVSEAQLNEVYNLMDVYCHPFTSGGQEVPIQEAKLTELITLVTNYSCGAEMCEEEAQSLPLEWAAYREPGTEFIKASTYPSSISKQLSKVLNMPEQKRKQMGKKAREWVINNFSIKVIGKALEDFLDAAPFTEYDFVNKEEYPDPYYQIPDIEDDSEWLIHLYKNILRMDVNNEDDGHKYWMTEFSKGSKRNDIERFFRNTAYKELQKKKPFNFEEWLNPDDKKRILFVMPESAGDIFLCTALFESIKNRYPDYSLYVATKPQFRDVLNGNPYVSKWIEYNPMMDNLLWLEGSNTQKGFFDIAYMPHVPTQRVLTYLHNGEDKIDFDNKICA